MAAANSKMEMTTSDATLTCSRYVLHTRVSEIYIKIVCMCILMNFTKYIAQLCKLMFLYVIMTILDF